MDAGQLDFTLVIKVRARKKVATENGCINYTRRWAELVLYLNCHSFLFYATVAFLYSELSGRPQREEVSTVENRAVHSYNDSITEIIPRIKVVRDQHILLLS